MTITATELKMNLSTYLEKAATEDIFISKNGKNIARLTSPVIDRLAVLDELAGIAAGCDDDIDSIREERLAGR